MSTGSTYADLLINLINDLCSVKSEKWYSVSVVVRFLLKLMEQSQSVNGLLIAQTQNLTL